MSNSVDRPTDRIYIAGAGRMGQGIALSFIFAGIPVVLIDLKDRSDEERRSYFAQITENIGKELKAMAVLDLIDVDEIATTLARVTYSDRAGVEAELIDSTLVFEGVPEVMEVKKEAFAWLDKFISAETIVASTTSTFLVTDLADFVSHPGRFINAHWLNPAHLMPLVEVSCGDTTDENVKEGLVEILKRVGKVPVVCSASAGYIVPRIQSLAMSEAVRMVDEGVASAEDIDTAVRVGFGLRFAVLGLLEFTDWGGGDILYYASNYLADSLDERFRPPDLVRENMEKGRNGIREGVGFYDYRNMDVEAYRQGRIADFVGFLRAAKLTPRFNGALGENNQSAEH